MEQTTDPDRIQVLLDRQQITDVIHRYSRAADRLDVELFKTNLWEDRARPQRSREAGYLRQGAQ